MLRVVLLLILIGIPAQTLGDEGSNAALRIERGEFDPTAWDRLLQTYVSYEGVDWDAWRKTDPGAVSAFLDSASAYSMRSVMGKEPKVAFLLNVYNAFAVSQILGHDPVKSIDAIPGFFDANTVKIDGTPRTLNDIHDMICQIGKHFPQCALAVASGARSHAPLVPRAYTSANLLTQATNAARVLFTENVVLDGPNKAITLPGAVEPRMEYYANQEKGLAGAFQDMVPSSNYLVVLVNPQEVLFAPMDFSLRTLADPTDGK